MAPALSKLALVGAAALAVNSNSNTRTGGVEAVQLRVHSRTRAFAMRALRDAVGAVRNRVLGAADPAEPAVPDVPVQDQHDLLDLARAYDFDRVRATLEAAKEAHTADPLYVVALVNSVGGETNRWSVLQQAVYRAARGGGRGFDFQRALDFVRELVEEWGADPTLVSRGTSMNDVTLLLDRAHLHIQAQAEADRSLETEWKMRRTIRLLEDAWDGIARPQIPLIVQHALLNNARDYQQGEGWWDAVRATLGAARAMFGPMYARKLVNSTPLGDGVKRYSVLHQAAYADDIEFVRELLDEWHADPNVTSVINKNLSGHEGTADEVDTSEEIKEAIREAQAQAQTDTVAAVANAAAWSSQTRFAAEVRGRAAVAGPAVRVNTNSRWANLWRAETEMCWANLWRADYGQPAAVAEAPAAVARAEAAAAAAPAVLPEPEQVTARGVLGEVVEMRDNSEDAEELRERGEDGQGVESRFHHKVYFSESARLVQGQLYAQPTLLVHADDWRWMYNHEPNTDDAMQSGWEGAHLGAFGRDFEEWSAAQVQERVPALAAFAAADGQPWVVVWKFPIDLHRDFPGYRMIVDVPLPVGAYDTTDDADEGYGFWQPAEVPADLPEFPRGQKAEKLRVDKAQGFGVHSLAHEQTGLQVAMLTSQALGLDLDVIHERAPIPQDYALVNPFLQWLYEEAGVYAYVCQGGHHAIVLYQDVWDANGPVLGTPEHISYLLANRPELRAVLSRFGMFRGNPSPLWAAGADFAEGREWAWVYHRQFPAVRRVNPNAVAVAAPVAAVPARTVVPAADPVADAVIAPAALRLPEPEVPFGRGATNAGALAVAAQPQPHARTQPQAVLDQAAAVVLTPEQLALQTEVLLLAKMGDWDLAFARLEEVSLFQDPDNVEVYQNRIALAARIASGDANGSRPSLLHFAAATGNVLLCARVWKLWDWLNEPLLKRAIFHAKLTPAAWASMNHPAFQTGFTPAQVWEAKAGSWIGGREAHRGVLHYLRNEGWNVEGMRHGVASHAEEEHAYLVPARTV